MLFNKTSGAMVDRRWAVIAPRSSPLSPSEQPPSPKLRRHAQDTERPRRGCTSINGDVRRVAVVPSPVLVLERAPHGIRARRLVGRNRHLTVEGVLLLGSHDLIAHFGRGVVAGARCDERLRKLAVRGGDVFARDRAFDLGAPLYGV